MNIISSTERLPEGFGNRTAMALLLTNAEEAISSQSCWLFGGPSAMETEWDNGVLGNPKNSGVKSKSHENTQSHIDVSIAIQQAISFTQFATLVIFGIPHNDL